MLWDLKIGSISWINQRPNRIWFRTSIATKAELVAEDLYALACYVK